MKTIIDDHIPFLPWTITIYIGCYIFWAIAYIRAVYLNKKNAEQFTFSHIIGETICFLIFVFYPTEIIRPEITDNTLFKFFTKLVYKYDEANNLFPSIHCFISWLCLLDAKKHKNKSQKFFYLSLIFAILVCISTLTVKQHVLVDVIAGICLAKFSYFLTQKLLKKIYQAFDSI